MSESDLLKQMRQEEDLYAAAIGKKVTEALNSKKTVAAADDLNATSGGWPYPPTREMLKLYDQVASKTWKSIERGYSDFDVSISVAARPGSDPSASATVKYAGAFKGGLSYVLRPGDTIASVAKDTYGYEAYANDIWDANAGVLGASCTVLPAGFGIELPRLWVPEWKKPPKAALSSPLKSKAVKILYPALEFDLETKRVSKTVIELVAATVEITLQVSGTFTAQKKGTIDASFNLRSYEASVAKSLGPLEGGFKMNLKEGKGDFSLGVSNSGVKGLSMTQKVAMKRDGTLTITFGSKKVSFTHKDWVVEGTVTCSADVKITLKPPPPVPVPSSRRVRVSAPKPHSWVPVLVIGLVGVGVVATCIYSVGTGCAPAATAGAALIVTVKTGA